MAKKKRVLPEADDVVEGLVGGEDQGRKGAKTAESANPSTQAVKDDVDEMGEFEDAWEDEESDEGEVVVAPDSEDEDGMDVDGDAQMDEEEEDDAKVYLPGHQMQEDEVLVADSSAYEMLHSMGAEWPCLSFDILRDNLGTSRSTFPMTTYFVAGSQADNPKNNKIYVMKASQLHRTKHDDDDGMGDESDDDDLDEDPILETRTVSHIGGVNRIRVMPHPESYIVASWADTGKVHIYDLTQHVRSLDTPGLIPPRDPAPVHTVSNHGKVEGYALDWSPVQIGRLLSGDQKGRIFQTIRTPSAWETNGTVFVGHTESVEDIQWSPKQEAIFASASVDKTIKIWDARQSKPSLSVTAHDSDVNVISWSRSVEYLLASGSDSGDFKIWDLRSWPTSTPQNPPEPAASFKWHKSAITSIEWKETESSVLAVAGADDQITIWDLALERDAEEEAALGTGPAGHVEVPPQLLFIHQGQTNIKELHWHSQVPGLLLSTAGDGFNIFKTINS